MIQKTINIFIDETYSKRPKRNYNRKETLVYHNDDIWSLDIIHLRDYNPEKKRRYR